MAVLEQILDLPFAFLWLPGLVFLIVGGGLYWLTRPAAPTVEAAADEVPGPAPILLKLKPPDQRESSRRLGNTVQVQVGTPDDKKNPGVGSVLDRSMGGMRLALYNEINSGTILSIRPVHANEMVPWIDLEVRSCKLSKEMPGQFEIGCQYVKSPPYSIQLLFG